MDMTAKEPITDNQWFAAIWRTPAQTRDLLIELSHPLTSKRINELRQMAHKEEAARKHNPDFIQCCHCKGHHGQKTNIDGLCEIHEAQFAPFRYDAKQTTSLL